ncbi:hypothetical protein, partial [Ruminococcus sp. CAG:330]|uniref:hypothetical protein n=1 Tax=Ruminococcus sp. CAG:330 TaxID=1262954 RepID=UPI00263F9386
NTSPTALSWISLIWDSFFQSFCFRTMIFVFGASDIDTTFFLSPSYISIDFFTGNLLLFSPKRAILFSISRVPFSAPERRFFYEAL